MNQQQAFARLEELDRHLVMLEHIGAALQWDQETVLRDKAVQERSSPARLACRAVPCCCKRG